MATVSEETVPVDRASEEEMAPEETAAEETVSTEPKTETG
jgi:hypothetical protein